MDLGEYQRAAALTDQQGSDQDKRLLVALLGLAGEVGTLLSEHKKWLRDGNAYDRRSNVAEDLGDILWYLASAASALEVDLARVAEANVAKIQDRWPAVARNPDDPLDVQLPPRRRFDETFPEHEQLPSTLSVTFAPLQDEPARVVGLIGGARPLGNLLRDNAYVDDGYRWHDALHLAHLAVLGWSPVMRRFLGRKRRSDATVDDVEDGGRAVAIEEGLSAAVFEYASRHSWLDGVSTVDTALLAAVRGLTRNLEVGDATLLEWEQSVLRGLACWRALRDHDGGVVTADLTARTLAHRPLTKEDREQHANVVAQRIRDGLK